MNIGDTSGFFSHVLTDSGYELQVWQLMLILLLVFIQGLFIFFDGRRHGVRYYWLWALWGLTTCPVPLLLYWFLVRRKSVKANASGLH